MVVSIILSSVLSIGYFIWFIKSKKNEQPKNLDKINYEDGNAVLEENIVADKS